MIKFNKKNSIAIQKRAEVYYQLEKDQEALSDFNELLKLEAGSYDGFFGRALL